MKLNYEEMPEGKKKKKTDIIKTDLKTVNT